MSTMRDRSIREKERIKECRKVVTYFRKFDDTLMTLAQVNEDVQELLEKYDKGEIKINSDDFNDEVKEIKVMSDYITKILTRIGTYKDLGWE